MNTRRLHSKILGVLSGVAMGDAFGMPCEMWSQDRILDNYSYIDRLYPGHPENVISAGLSAGEITDDTAFTLIIGNMLIENSKNIDPLVFVEKVKEWANNNEKSKNVLGPSTKRAFQEIEDGSSIEYAGRMGETNGAAMRVLPIGIISDYNDLSALIENVRLMCLPTHNTNKAIAGSSAIAAAVSYAIRCGNDINEMIDIAIEAAIKGSKQGYDVCGPDIAKRIEFAVDIARNAYSQEEFLTNVYDLVGTGLPTAQAVASVFAIVLYAKADPNLCAKLSANIGGDTDTIGAMSCGIAGGFSGIEKFDREILDTVIKVNNLDLESITRKLINLYFN